MSDESDGLTKVHVDLPNHWWMKGESMWAEPLANDLYEIRNVPFCAYGLNFGDVVLATAGEPGLKPEIRSVVRRSGNSTLRINFDAAVDRAQQTVVLYLLCAMGVAVERANDRFVCLDVPPEVDYQAVRTLLVAQETEGLLEYETCEARIEGSFDDRPSEE
jgi:hypothetical protein